MAAGDLAVLVVDDDFRVAALHAGFVEDAPGYTTAARAGSVHEARSVLADRHRRGLPPVDLALVDLYLPDGSGLELVRTLACDVLVLSAATEPESVRAVLRAGAVGFLLKPFPEDALQARLRAYARYRRLLDARGPLTQDAVDAALASLAEPTARRRPAASTRTTVLDALRAAPDPVSAVEVAEATGVSRATAQRYLAELAGEQVVQVHLRYGATGRPEHRYAADPAGSG